MASGGEAVGGASLSLPSAARGLMARGRRERLGPVHRAGGVRHCTGRHKETLQHFCSEEFEAKMSVLVNVKEKMFFLYS